MRHNQNGRRYRGRGNNGGGHNHNHNNNGQGRRVNPRVQTFDSNGPDVRVRGNAFQINEKYLALAKDASSAGDRILAESYLQHAEHYQRMINEMTEEYNRQNPHAAQQQHNGQGGYQGGEDQPSLDAADAEQPTIDGDLVDLDQGFLVGSRSSESETAQPEPRRQGRSKAVAEGG